MNNQFSETLQMQCFKNYSKNFTEIFFSTVSIKLCLDDNKLRL